MFHMFKAKINYNILGMSYNSPMIVKEQTQIKMK